ncbi:hypothetical protein PCH70_31190 [Pseudomonas cichorii JBC1]|nr:hypothetical protein PCH70_31190 [Pseudomonas cichorii JBC1]
MLATSAYRRRISASFQAFFASKLPPTGFVYTFTDRHYRYNGQ